MGYNDRLLDETITKVETCPQCGNKFECTYEEQTPGCRFPEDKICPHCGAILRTSLEYDFITKKF